MSDDLTDPCEYCGAGSDNIAFVRYVAKPNDAQTETDWYDNTPDEIYSSVCTNCGLGKAGIDPRDNEQLPDFEDLPDGDGSRSFKVDDRLE